MERGDVVDDHARGWRLRSARIVGAGGDGDVDRLGIHLPSLAGKESPIKPLTCRMWNFSLPE